MTYIEYVLSEKEREIQQISLLIDVSQEVTWPL